jgi:hypothetical protein
VIRNSATNRLHRNGCVQDWRRVSMVLVCGCLTGTATAMVPVSAHAQQPVVERHDWMGLAEQLRRFGFAPGLARKSAKPSDLSQGELSNATDMPSVVSRDTQGEDVSEIATGSLKSAAAPATQQQQSPTVPASAPIDPAASKPAKSQAPVEQTASLTPTQPARAPGGAAKSQASERSQSRRQTPVSLPTPKPDSDGRDFDSRRTARLTASPIDPAPVPASASPAIPEATAPDDTTAQPQSDAAPDTATAAVVPPPPTPAPDRAVTHSRAETPTRPVQRRSPPRTRAAAGAQRPEQPTIEELRRKWVPNSGDWRKRALKLN